MSNIEKDCVYFSILYGEGKLGLNISISPDSHLPVISHLYYFKNVNTYSCFFNQFDDKESDNIIYSIEEKECLNITKLDELKKIIQNSQRPMKITYMRRNYTQYIYIYKYI